jgi:Zn-dependent protease
LSLATTAILGLFVSIVLHEMAHALVARHFGLKVRRITLFLFGGVAELESEPLSGQTEFWIAIAGPVASLCIAFVFWGVSLVTLFTGASESLHSVLGYLAALNLALALFNLLPAFPMDGGRVLRAWLWVRLGDLLAATRRATAVSTVLSYALVAFGLLLALSGAVALGLWAILIALFLLAAAGSTLSNLEEKKAFEGRAVSQLMSRDPWTVSPELSLAELVNDVFFKRAVTFAPVVEKGVLLGYVDTQIVRKIDRENWTTTKVNDVVESSSDENTVTYDMPATDLMAKILKTGRRKFLVIDAQGLAGVVSLSDMFAILNVSNEVG